MKISEAIDYLNNVRAKEGDLEIGAYMYGSKSSLDYYFCQTITITSSKCKSFCDLSRSCDTQKVVIFGIN